MNPFDLHGFAFLTFYVLFATGLLLLLRWWMNRDGDDKHLGAIAREMAQDPYSIAYLRSGPAEAGRVATIALIDRGLLRFDVNSKKLQADTDALKMVRRPIERAVLAEYLQPQTVWHYMVPSSVHISCEEYQRQFERHGLLPDAGALLQRWMLTLAILFLLIATTVAKVHIALEQGRHNLGFLVALTVIFSLIAPAMARRRASGRGKVLLDDLRTLFRRLKDRSDTISAGGATNEAALLVAVFGVNTLPASNFPFVSQLYPASSGGGDGGSSSCGSGGSCGGGCGGGGCGG